MAAARVDAGGGRVLDLEVLGPDDGQTVIFHNGTPAAGHMFAPLVQLGAARGVRHVSYSRPGYAGSDRHPGRTVADCARDVSAIADHLGVDRFYTLGISGGGPHALACAALMPERVIAAATLGSVAPWEARGLDFLDGMGEENLAEFGAAQAGERQLERYLEAELPAFAQVTGADIVRAFGDLASGPDRDALSGEFGEYVAGCVREGLAPGIWGWFDDDIAFISAWGFEFGSTTRPVTIWHGHHDRFVPLAHGQWLAANVPGSRARLSPDHGHLSLEIGAYGEVLDDLLSTPPA